MFSVITGAAGAVADAARRAVATLPGGSVSFRVEPEQVYELANQFEQIADRINHKLEIEIWALRVRAPGVDKPSEDATHRLTETSFGQAGLVTRLHRFVTELDETAKALRVSGQQYGLTDHTEGGRLSAADH